MRLQFKTTVRVKKLANNIVGLSKLKHGQALDLVANLCGYENYYELNSSLVASLPDIEFSTQQRVAFVEKLAAEVGISHGDAIHALESSRLLGDKSVGTKELIAVRSELFSREYRKDSLRRKKGEIGKLRNLMGGETVGILRKFGRLTTVITDKTANATVADFEYTSPRVHLPFFIPKRLYLPYGHWIEKDGSWVLFSRDYFPLWRIRSGRAPERLDPSERIVFEFSNYYWGDHRVPWSDKELCNDLIEDLDELGVRSLPRSVEVLKTILDDDKIKDFKDAVPSYWFKAA